MKAVKANLLYDGATTVRNVYVTFEGDVIRRVTSEKPEAEILGEGIVTPAFIDGHSHIGMARSGEPGREDEGNEEMDPLFPLVSAIHSVYMDDIAFKESVESGVLYSTVLPGSGNIVGGRAVLIRNYASNIEQAKIMDVGVKAALGYNPRSTTEWKGKRPTTRMGAIALLRESLIKATKTKRLLSKRKKQPDEIEPVMDAFIDILDRRLKLMVHLHKEDDAMVLIQLVNEFGFKAVLNHGMDIFREEAFARVAAAGIPIVYGPLDSFPYKVELKHESWRNAQSLLKSGAKFCMMSDHPVILQRNMFYTLRHFLRFGLSKEAAVSKVTKDAAEILGAKGIGEIKNGFKASLVVWNGDPFDLSNFPTLVIGEGKEVHREE